jgi:hypothetical protein
VFITSDLRRQKAFNKQKSSNFNEEKGHAGDKPIVF